MVSAVQNFEKVYIMSLLTNDIDNSKTSLEKGIKNEEYNIETIYEMKNEKLRDLEMYKTQLQQSFVYL